MVEDSTSVVNGLGGRLLLLRDVFLMIVGAWQRSFECLAIRASILGDSALLQEPGSNESSQSRLVGSKPSSSIRRASLCNFLKILEYAHHSIYIELIHTTAP